MSYQQFKHVEGTEWEYRGIPLYVHEQDTNGYPAVAFTAQTSSIPGLEGAYVSGFSDSHMEDALAQVANAVDVLISKGVIEM